MTTKADEELAAFVAEALRESPAEDPFDGGGLVDAVGGRRTHVMIDGYFDLVALAGKIHAQIAAAAGPAKAQSVRMQETPFSIYQAEWLIDTWNGDRIKEKLAYCKSFACAEAAYEAAVKAMPYERITFRHRTRVIREHVGEWTPDSQRQG